ncbi:MAG TPA: ferric reductase-like transmembrane domain-containing protein [Actinophytocola sp.]|uniref:ferric reductase-like transmembrane domain-containing protein n=1 Tax=Actinophytocola sp. TaxID=1872138 RepID=UPI002DDCCF90|nr:ferric reductase-like transmembrane domain-containing protein [Actinophytocola sp.]HEV2783568.1 ferric reductase-like transmembrane domain-containing protein [Actinophytocola sp.]
MLYQLAQGAADPGHDAGIRELAALSARLAYAMMCLTLCWGILTSLGWVNRITGRQAVRNGHMMLATLTLAFAGVHGVAFLLLRNNPWTLTQLLMPFHPGGQLRYTMGILAFEGMLAAAVAIGLKRWMTYRRWLGIHRLTYPAFMLGVGHAFLAAMANGSLATLWLAGITLLVPAVTLAIIRFVPAKALATTGLLEDVP